MKSSKKLAENILNQYDPTVRKRECLKSDIIDALDRHAREAREEALDEAANMLDLPIKAFESNTPLNDLKMAYIVKTIQAEIRDLKTPEREKL